ncbi:MAG: NADH-ubiquinone oxidoreductase-F iron-sulfur binding region domain-containing protein [Planctomycetota bacterium]
MQRLASIAELRMLRRHLQKQADISKPCAVLCAGTACQAGGCNTTIRAVKRHILENGLSSKVRLRITGCHGFCEMGPFIWTQPQGAFYSRLTPEDVGPVLDKMAVGEIADELLYSDPVTKVTYRDRDEIPFFKYQQRAILAMNQEVDPIRINDYIAHDGYAALEHVLEKRDPAWVLEEVKKSAIRGRGGAGFPTGRKWELLAKQPSGRGKFLVCNADEGDPGAYMDRSILEGNPHSIIEGMTIGALGTGATEGVVYVRSEYPLAIKDLTIALRQARELGILGPNILGTGLSFDIQIVRGAGAFVCGEETALIRSIEGKRGEPVQRPPFPVEKGIEGKPTGVNNVETWANIPLIFRMGAEEFAKIGTKDNSGSKIFSLVGKIKNTGLVEVPMGISIREVIYDVGGGPASEARIKAVQTGGPSGGCIPADRFDLPIDYDSLAEAGSIMGSGGMIVMDDDTCMVDVAKYFMKFLMEESCGKCFTCRKGTQRMYEILDDITCGKGTAEHLELLEELSHVVRDTTMCGLGQSAPNPVLSTLRYFRKEYEEHIRDHRCRAFVCTDLVGAPCQTGCPLGTQAWRYIAHIARGEYEDAYQAIREANPFPSVCARVCTHPCEDRCRCGTSGQEPIAIRDLKRFVTDRVDPSVYRPHRVTLGPGEAASVAIIGSGPAGLSAAHLLSVAGHKVTVFDEADRPGGMLISGIPSYRLPRETIEREIAALLDDNIDVECNTALGRDITIDDLFDRGFKAVFLAMGAHKSRPLNVDGEEVSGVYPGLDFLKAFNEQGRQLAQGRVVVIGGGESAIDAAGVAIRQKGVESAGIYYRRTRVEMPAHTPSVNAALEEGITLETLITPVRILVEDGRVKGVEFVKNRLGDFDSSGRRRPEPIPGSEQIVPVDTLVVSISEEPGVDYLADMGVELTRWQTVRSGERTLETSRPGVFAGGDVVTGPNTVVDAIAAGKRAAAVIGRWLRGEDVDQPLPREMPEEYVEPEQPPKLGAEARTQSFDEVEGSLSVEDAKREARRCLRCDLEFTQPAEPETPVPMTVGVTA